MWGLLRLSPIIVQHLDNHLTNCNFEISDIDYFVYKQEYQNYHDYCFIAVSYVSVRSNNYHDDGQ